MRDWFAGIEVGSRWTRPALATLWGYSGYQALARGVVTPAGEALVILFVTEQKQSASTPYVDRLAGNRLDWEGPADHFAEARMVHGNNLSDELHLFHRTRHHLPFVYRGQIHLVSAELNVASSSRFVFELGNTP